MLAGEPTIGDAFGRAILEFLDRGSDGWGHFVERDDGLLEYMDAGVYFDVPSPWSVEDEVVTARSGGRVLDIGAGAGRHALPLQESGREVVALDVSAGALEVCRRRGVTQTFEGTVFDLAESGSDPFDTFLLCGNNFGLLESPEHGPRFLATLRGLAAPGAVIIGTCRDPLATEDPLHLAYHELNRGRGRLPGQLRLRARWANLATPWFDYLFVSVDDLAAMASPAGWRLADHREGNPYVAVLELG